MIQEDRIVFVFGSPKSGTTYLQMILDAHPEVSCPPEHNFMQFLNGLRQLIEGYNRLLVYSDEITARQGAVLFENDDLEHLFKEAVIRAALKGARGRKVRLYGVKDNHFVAWISLMERLFPEARIISPVRDPRSVVLSGWYFNSRIDPTFRRTRGRTQELWAQDMGSIWRRDIEALLKFRKRYPDRILFVKYEELRKDPERECARIFDFLEVKSDGSILADIVKKTSFDKFKDGRFFRKGSLDDWKRELVPEAIRIIEKLNLHLMKEFGYQTIFF
ncbi:sulfotransferase [Thermosulfurimonas sp. F29]|uniref:sulfotransferase n=1 Tax=Thermosulfurimonas sp. F29 TaxID=2867247 RepID=UPI001C82ECC4|nr:sulfotransferase [Thermosulfurimonas sp. F29]MBX6422741.1 sulfotransferase [Thermosulfurimonas sp. F29]